MFPMVENAVTLHTVSAYFILKPMTVFSQSCLKLGGGKSDIKRLASYTK